MNVRQLFQKAFVGGQWYVAYRKNSDKDFQVISTSNDIWIADPFLYEYNGEHFLFVEVYEKKYGKASIGYFKFENGIPVYKGIVIRESFHMSYPCVFEENGTIYMIPETSADKSIRLYKAVSFPDKWVFEKKLIEGARYVDTTYCQKSSQSYLLTYKKENELWVLDIFKFNIKGKIFDKISSKNYDENCGRPAGFVFDKVYRPAQFCKNKYGEKLIVYLIEKMVPYKEKMISELTIENFDLSDFYDRVHTYNKNSMYEVIDLFKENLDLFHGFKIFKRKYLTR